MKTVSAAVLFVDANFDAETLGATVQDYIHQAERQARAVLSYPGSRFPGATTRFKLLAYAFYVDSFGRTWLTVSFKYK